MLSSTDFTWPILEYCVPFIPGFLAISCQALFLISSFQKILFFLLYELVYNFTYSDNLSLSLKEVFFVTKTKTVKRSAFKMCIIILKVKFECCRCVDDLQLIGYNSLSLQNGIIFLPSGCWNRSYHKCDNKVENFCPVGTKPQGLVIF